MAVNLTDWLGTHLGLLWLLIGVMLLTLELLRRDLTMAMVALGAAAAALTALLVPHAWYVQVAVGVAVSVVAVLVARPALLRLEAGRNPPRA